MNGKIITLRLYMESSDFIYNYTGKLSKTILLTEAPELEHVFKPMKGFFKQVRVSPPICGGKAVIPVYDVKLVKGKPTFELKPVALRGEYMIEVGASGDLVDSLYTRFKQAVGLKTRLKFENSLITYIVKDALVVEPRIRIEGGVVGVVTVSPALIPNPLTPTQHVRRFTASPGALLWVPHMMSRGVLSYNRHDAERTLVELEACLSEHYSTKVRTVFVSYDGSKEPALEVKTKYIITNPECREMLERTLTTARIFGVGASRANGFGTITLKTLYSVDTGSTNNNNKLHYTKNSKNSLTLLHEETDKFVGDSREIRKN